MHKKCTRKMSQMVLAVIVSFASSTPVLAAVSIPAPTEVQIVDEAMCCAGCARKVSGQLYATRGVKNVSVDMKSRTVTVSMPAASRPATLGQLWQAVEKGDGTPTKLVTAEATYTLTRPKNASAHQPSSVAQVEILIDNLHCQGCAKKIAAQLYTLKGVTKVSVDMKRETLFVATQQAVQLSPWIVIDAVARANERPLAVVGRHGELSIGWATKAAPKPNQHADLGGIKR